MTISVLHIVDREAYESDKKTLLEMLDTITIPKIERNRRDTDGNVIVRNREAIIGTEGRTCNFGLIRGRQIGYAVSKYSIKYPRIYRAIFDFAKHVCPPGMDVTSVTLNYGVKAKKHKDSFNVGDSVIVGISDYQGGKLRVYTSETDYTAYDIKDTPLMFNGSELAHETEDFSGERYTIIYYSQRPKNREWTVEFPVVGTAQCLEPGNRTVPG